MAIRIPPMRCMFHTALQMFLFICSPSPENRQASNLFARQDLSTYVCHFWTSPSNFRLHSFDPNQILCRQTKASVNDICQTAVFSYGYVNPMGSTSLLPGMGRWNVLCERYHRTAAASHWRDECLGPSCRSNGLSKLFPGISQAGRQHFCQ